MPEIWDPFNGEVATDRECRKCYWRHLRRGPDDLFMALFTAAFIICTSVGDQTSIVKTGLIQPVIILVGIGLLFLGEMDPDLRTNYRSELSNFSQDGGH
jgi:hypothetical protein